MSAQRQLLTPDTYPLFDTSRLESLVGQDKAGLIELLEIWTRISDTYLNELHLAAANGDYRGVAEVAHKLTSSSLSIGAVELAAALQTIERCCRTGTTARVDSIIVHVQNVYTGTVTAIADWMEAPQAPR